MNRTFPTTADPAPTRSKTPVRKIDDEPAVRTKKTPARPSSSILSQSPPSKPKASPSSKSKASPKAPSAGQGRYSSIVFGALNSASETCVGKEMPKSSKVSRASVDDAKPAAPANTDASRLIVAQSQAVEELYGMVARCIEMQTAKEAEFADLERLRCENDELGNIVDELQPLQAQNGELRQVRLHVTHKAQALPRVVVVAQTHDGCRRICNDFSSTCFGVWQEIARLRAQRSVLSAHKSSSPAKTAQLEALLDEIATLKAERELHCIATTSASPTADVAQPSASLRKHSHAAAIAYSCHLRLHVALHGADEVLF